MNETTLELSDADRQRLERLARREGRSMAEVMRAALAEYEARRTVRRTSALAGQFTTDKKPVSEMTPEEMDEMMRDFGE